MTYTPINWQTGDTITAAKLNRCDNGWAVESTQLFSETVTTVAGQYGNYGTLSYATQMDAPSVIVTFDGTNYTCNAVDLGGATYYGGISGSGPDFSEYPFAIESAVSAGGPNGVYTQTAGEHTIAGVASTLQTSADFAAAVNAVSPLFVATENVTTWQEIHDAIADGMDVRINSASGSSVYSEPVYSATFDGTNYEVAVLFVFGGAASAKYYIAVSADSAIMAN